MIAVESPQPICLMAMTEAHLEGVEELREQLLGEPRNRNFLAAGLRASNQDHIVAVAVQPPDMAQKTTVIGYAAALHVTDESQLIAIAVAPSQQGRGIATRLLAELLRAAAHRGVRAFGLEVRLSNLRAQALYRRFGFMPVGVRRDYYPPSLVGPREHALIMWSPDISSPEVLRQLAKVSCSRPRF